MLLGTTSSIAWLLGTLLGAALAWPGGSDEWGDKASTADPHGQSLRSSSAAMRLVLRAFGRTLGRPKFVQFVFPPLMLLSAAPYFITAMLLLYLLAFKLRLFPQGGGYEAGTFPDMSPTFALNLVQHAVLPALSIVLASIATWAIGMRALVVSLKDEDYMLLAEAKGLKRPTIFVRYAIRNAVLPQVTGLGLALGQIVSGALLVEAVFRYPGLGGLLLRAIITRDYVLEQGIVLIIIVSIAMVTLVLDLTYPILDPRLAARARSS